MTTFSEFMREIEREAEAEGPDAVAEIRDFHEWYRKTRQMMKMSPPTVREHPLVAEYLVTLEAPSQATSDGEKATIGSVCKAMLIGAVEGLAEALAETTHLTGYRVRIDPLALGPKCAACSRSVLEQISSATRSNTEVMEAMQRVEKHRTELVERLAALEGQKLITAMSVSIIGKIHGGPHLSVTLSDGRVIQTPLSWYPKIVAATDEQRANYRLIGGGIGIHWPDIDEDLSVFGMLVARRP